MNAAIAAARLQSQRITLPRDEALGMLVRRYFGSHGPATVRDFAWWSGLTTADAERGLEIVRARQTAIDGYSYWTVGRGARADPPRNAATHLLPIYDEYLVAYRDRIAVPHAASPPATFHHALVIDGQVAGTWRTARNRDGLAMTITPLRTLTGRERRAARDAALRYQRFLGTAISIT